MLATASAQVCVPLGHSSLYLHPVTPANRVFKYADDRHISPHVVVNLLLSRLYQLLTEYHVWLKLK